MARDLHELLGGYATGTLTEEERTALFEAALHDQQLFNALADEEALRELLDDPGSRRRLLEILEQASSRKQKGWLTTVFEPFRRPVNLALAGSVAVTAVAVFVFANLMREAPLETPGRSAAEKTDDSVRVREKPVHPQQRPEPAQSSEATPLPPPPLPAAQRAQAARPTLPPSEAPDTAGQSSRLDTRSLETSTPAPAFRLSLLSPFVNGPARELFYRSPETQPSAPGDILAEPPRRQDAARRSRQGPETSAPAPGSAGSQLPQAYPLIGLSLGLETRGPDGTYAATEFGATLDQHGARRLRVEANTNGYLYAGMLEAGTWHWLYPSPAGPGGGLTNARIQREQWLTLPLSLNAQQAQEPGQNRLLIILSREMLPELETTLSRAAEGGLIARDIQNWLERWSALNRTDGPIVEQPSDRRIYVVSPSAPTVPLVIEFDVLPQ